MSPPEIAFLALGLIVGTAIGAAFIEALRARPVPRREVRLTVSPNSIVPRRSATLSAEDPFSGQGSIPGSPADEEWLERRLARIGVRAGESAPEANPMLPARTRVPSGPVSVPSSAVAVPVGPVASSGAPAEMTGWVSPLVRAVGDAPSATRSRVAATGVVLDAPRETRGAIEDHPASPRATPSRLSPAVAGVSTEPDPPEPQDRPSGSPVAEAGSPVAEAGSPVAEAGSPVAEAGSPGPGSPPAGGGARTDSASGPAGSASCEAERVLVQERCAVADASREQARRAAETLRDAQRAYDDLRERVERAQAASDPREIRASKDALHRTFRAARAAAATSAEAEEAAREWLNEINRLNTATREAVHEVETGNAQLRELHPRLERLAVEADAARITADSAAAGCQEARSALARCEEQAALAASAAAAAAAAPEPVASTLDGVWPTEAEAPMPAAPVDLMGGDEPPPVIRILRGERQARERLVAALAGPDAEAARQWQLRIAAFSDAVAARAIEDGYLALPDEGFWGLFTSREQRDIVAALSALGFRYDGMGGFADGRVPAQRDLSLAVGYAGLDRMRIRIWPREAELPGLYAGALVAADEWLIDEAGDLSLGRMVDALGGRAAELADLWNAWGRVRPALLGTV